jgi:hypothetical protein
VVVAVLAFCAAGGFRWITRSSDEPLSPVDASTGATRRPRAATGRLRDAALAVP